MANPKRPDFKAQILREHGVFYARTVEDALFQASAFFDPRDLVQVKYEMLRRVHTDGQSVCQATEAFGFSRPTFYKAQAEFEREGIAGLLPRKRGPRRRHKLTSEVLAFVESLRAQQPIAMPELIERVEEHFGLRVHKRSLERALSHPEKKTP